MLGRVLLRSLRLFLVGPRLGQQHCELRDATLPPFDPGLAVQGSAFHVTKVGRLSVLAKICCLAPDVQAGPLLVFDLATFRIMGILQYLVCFTVLGHLGTRGLVVSRSNVRRIALVFLADARHCFI